MAFDPISLLIEIAIAVALNIVAYVLAPKPKQSKPASATQLDDPIAEAGREIPVVFGTVWVTQPNCLWFGDKAVNEYAVRQ